MANNLNTLLRQLGLFSYEDIDVHALECLEELKKSQSKGSEKLTQAQLNQLLIIVSCHKNLDAARWLIERGADVNYSNHGESVLAAAINSGRSYELCQLLIDNGADVFAVDSRKTSMLMFAVDSMPDLRLAKLLLDKGVDINLANMYGETVLSKTVTRLDDDEIAFLLVRGADQYSKNAALIRAAYIGNKSAIQLLLDAGADVNFIKHDDLGILAGCAADNAAEHGYTDILKMILDRNPNLQVKTTALHAAVKRFNYNEVKLTLDCGADPNGIDDEGYSPLMQALGNKCSFKFIKLLIDSGAKVDFQNKDGNTPLFWALGYADVQTIQYIISHGAKFYSTLNREGDTLLFNAVYNKDVNILKMALDSNANLDINHINKYKENALYMAVANKNIEAVKLLLSYGADPNAIILGGETILHKIANTDNLPGKLSNSDREELLLLMLNCGANPYICDEKGRTAVDVCSTKKMKKILVQNSPINKLIKSADSKSVDNSSYEWEY